MVIVRTPHQDFTCETAREIAAAIYEVLPDKDKAATLADGIMEVAAQRPTDVPPLIINLNRDV